MKRKNLAVCVCIMVLIMMTGCGAKNEDTQPVEIVEAGDQLEDIELVSETEDTKQTPETEIEEDKFKDELCGEVIEINSGEKTVMVSKRYTETDSEGNGIMVAYANDEDAEKIKVCFTDEANYILETGKADGTNVTQSQAAFSDISEGDVLELKGLEAVTGDEFLATWVKIERVIN